MRAAARMLAKTPLLTGTAIALLAIGIGGGTLLFSAFEAVWLRPLAVRHPEQLVRMVQVLPRLGKRSFFSYTYYRTLKEHSTTLAAEFGALDWNVAVSEPGPAEQLHASIVTPEYFDELGVRALYGRVLAADDQDVVVLSHGFWQRHFHGDPAALGHRTVLHGHPFTIAGVMPAGFNGLAVDTSPDVWAPKAAMAALTGYKGPSTPDAEYDFQLDLAARLKPGVTLRQAQAECLALWRADVEKGPLAEIELRRGMWLDPIERGVSIVREKYGDAVKLAAAASGVLLLLVCANVAGLMLAGAAARRPEIAVRLALGATRARLAGQMLGESLLLVAAGAAGGWLLAWTCAPLFVRVLPPVRDLGTNALTIALDLRPDGRVMLVAMAAAGLTAVLVGLAPALTASLMNTDAVLRGVRASTTWTGRKALVIAQVALCTLLVAGAGLLVRTVQQLHAVGTGLDIAHVATFSADPGLMGYQPAQAKVLWANLVARVRELPGVVSAAAANRPLMRGSGFKSTVAPVGQRAEASDFLNTSNNSITPEYFDSMGMRFVQGRGFLSSDLGATKPAPAVVNEAFVRRFFPEGDPIGKLFGNTLDAPAKANYQIVGVVRDAKYRGLREAMTPTFYAVSDSGFTVLSVRTKGAPEAIVEPVRKVLAALDPALPFTEVHTLAGEAEASIAAERATAALGSGFAAFASFLAAAGIYGLLAFAVEQRRREIGIRMALGARPGQIGWLLGRQTALLVVAGLVIGLGATLLLAGSVRALLYGIAPADPLSLALAAAIMAAVAAAATLVPARRATRVQPASALRQ